MQKAIDNIELYASEFGPVGTYWDHIKDFGTHTNIGGLIDLNLNWMMGYQSITQNW